MISANAVAECLSHLHDLEELEKIEAGPADSLRLVGRAELIHTVASRIITLDPNSSLVSSYDAVRKSLDAILVWHGYRVSKPVGNHWTYIKITRCSAFESKDWDDLVWMRSRRNAAEYFEPGSSEVDLAEAIDALGKAAHLVNQVHQSLMSWSTS